MATIDAPDPAVQPAGPLPIPRPPGGERMIIYHWCLSLLIVSYKRASPIKVIQPGQSRIRAGIPYSLLSLVVGWWGIPWGPIWTIEALIKNFRGGTDVTDAVYGAAMIEAAAAAHFAEMARAAEAPEAPQVGPAPEAPAVAPEALPGASEESPLSRDPAGEPSGDR